MLASSNGSLTGYYRESQGSGVVKTCAFFISNDSSETGSGSVLTWSSAIYPGVLSAEEKGVKLRIEHGRDHAGCGLVLLPQVATKGMRLELTVPTQWTSLRSIRAERAYFYSAPLEAKKRRAFVIKGDVVGIVSSKGAWLEAEYYDSDKAKIVAKGWLKAEDTAEIHPPKK